jgi:hypothetical protein
VPDVACCIGYLLDFQRFFLLDILDIAEIGKENRPVH